jgi:3-hydroxyisobutyrate dehydrogenase-like beta-hydroxyacid dehydrogenase
MHIGLVGLGKMGNNMRARLRNAGIEVTGYDANPAVSDVSAWASAPRHCRRRASSGSWSPTDRSRTP